ncbi:hypothetical protein E0L93_14445, partial [Rubrobacter taiwanensis]
MSDKGPIIKPHTVAAAGMASAIAAFFTSSIGVAGTLIGAALTSMIITTASAFLNVKLESASSRLARIPQTVRQRVATSARPGGGGSPEPRPASGGMKLYGSRRRFSKLSPRRRKSVLATGIAAGALAFFLSMGGITAVEAAVGKSFTCFWQDCTAEAGIGQQAPSTTLGAITERARSGATAPEQPTAPQIQQPGSVQQEQPGWLDRVGGSGQQQTQPAPGMQPAPGSQPAPGTQPQPT